MKKQFKINIDNKWCNECSLYSSYCPIQTFSIGEDFKTMSTMNHNVFDATRVNIVTPIFQFL